ncbi:hypothetical protein WKW79_00635 [Variovorax robiniae]|uniref:Uncharacterized protein n=1 Tax=Variovorax robiniae TaxID=1836199 RepID=A0ABU8WZX6_9BURK
MREATDCCSVVDGALRKGRRWVPLVRRAAHVSMPNAIMANEGMHDVSP